MKTLFSFFSVVIFLLSAVISPNISFSQQTYILLGWNDLGMHCANQDFSKVAVLPPYNNVQAQLILKQPGQNPQIVNAGYKIEYYIPGNTYSVGKTNFWTYAQQLFGLPQPLPANIGLTGHSLTGLFDTSGNGFIITGVPVTPFGDSDLVHEQPFQLIHLSAKLINGSNVLAFTDCVIPVSNEVGCVQSGCHSSVQNILNEHEPVPGFNQNGPVLCAHCHASNALGTVGDSLAKAFSYRIHEKHSFIYPANDINTCYKCHPGPNTQCLRDTMRTGGNMICQNCHGTMDALANSIVNGRRPWLDEPRCGNITCHGNNFSEEPGKLYRMSKGHGGLFCSACHGSPHAIQPSREANDNLQNIRLQGHRGVLKDCLVCHSSPPTGSGPHGINFIGINPVGNSIPREFKLYQNYPNPFNPTTKIKFDIPARNSDGNSVFVKMIVYDFQGKEVQTLIKGEFMPGSYETAFDASHYSSGVYFYQLMTPDFCVTRKMTIVK
jgi:hypothetical protein